MSTHVPWYILASYIAQIATPVVTALGLAFVWRQVQLAKKQAEAGLRAALAASEQAETGKLAAQASIQQTQIATMSLEHLKKNASPRLVITPIYSTRPVVTGISLMIENYGASMAILRLLTIRNDIKTNTAFEPCKLWRTRKFFDEHPVEESRITDFPLEAHGVCVFFLPLTNDMDPSTNLYSSISVYYSDDFGRVFKSRVHYVWSTKNAAIDIEIVAREHEEVPKLPLNPHGGNDTRVYGDLEGGPAVADVVALRGLHLSDSMQRLASLTCEGLDETKGQKLTIQSYQFSSNGWPEFHVTVGSHDTFVISYFRDEHRRTIVIAPEDNNGNDRLEAFGLSFSAVNDSSQRLRLYSHVCIAALKHLKTDFQKEYPDFLVI